MTKEEAIKRIKDWNLDDDDIEVLSTLIPELKESEDERMIKFISNELVCLIAVDEKGSDRYEELTNAIVWLEKRGENKSVWNKDDDRIFDKLMKYFDLESRYYFDENDYNEARDWVKSIKERMHMMQPIK